MVRKNNIFDFFANTAYKGGKLLALIANEFEMELNSFRYLQAANIVSGV